MREEEKERREGVTHATLDFHQDTFSSLIYRCSPSKLHAVKAGAGQAVPVAVCVCGVRVRVRGCMPLRDPDGGREQKHGHGGAPRIVPVSHVSPFVRLCVCVCTHACWSACVPFCVCACQFRERMLTRKYTTSHIR
eukprot:502779-Pleurochrysis_carterae.AAC.1